MIRRKMTTTICDVVTPDGEMLGEASYYGKISPARLAKVARRLYKNQLVTITNYRTVQETYEMEEDAFIANATKVD